MFIYCYVKITLQYKVFVLHTASWTAASDRETHCVKMLNQFLKALY
jgi:hypothetical protein